MTTSRTKKAKRTKKLSSAGWHSLAPSRHERTVMKKQCGSKCFLGPVGESCFPICKKGTCTVNDKGVYAAYVRAREYGSPNKKSNKKKHAIYGHNHTKKLYRKIASKAKTFLKKHGYKANLS
jgi:hypothetical protein